MRLIFLLTFLLACYWSSAQTGRITGKISDAEGRSVENANVMLLRSADSALIKGTVSDSSGKYSFENIVNGGYIIMSSFAGMDPAFTQAFQIGSTGGESDLGILFLNNSEGRLKEVAVVARKPMIEQKSDRLVINVANSITNSTGSALDVLEKSPGVSVNRQNNSIAINGKSGVTVMINGKITYMPMDAVVQLLENTSAANIDRVELITAPPSKYDASGNGGFINIVLIDNPYHGFSGSWFVTGGHANKISGAAGGNFNYRTARVNLFGNYSFTHDPYLQPLKYFTQFSSMGNIISNNSFADRDATQQNHHLRIGMDYQLDSSTILGVLLSGYNKEWRMTTENSAATTKNGIPDTTINTLAHEINHWQNILANVNLQHTFKRGRILFFDMNYIYYKDDNPNTYTNNYYSKENAFINAEEVRSGKVTPIKFGVFSSDYMMPLGKRVKMEAGAKLALSSFSNDISVDKMKEGEWGPVGDLTANYSLKENIGSAYSSFTINTNNKIVIRAGLRYEYTTSKLGTTRTAEIFDRKYGKLFPSLNISKKFEGGNQVNISYNRRITRPTFNELAPFTIFFDPKTFFTGNPALQPAIADVVQGSFGMKNYTFSLSYTYEKNTLGDFIFQTQKIDTLNYVLYLSPRNYQYSKVFTAGITQTLNVTSWWSMQNSVNGGWKQISTVTENIPFKWQFGFYKLMSTQRFTLPNNFSAEITANYTFDNYFGTAKAKALYRLDAGLQKKFNNKVDVLSFSATDILNTGTYYKYTEHLPSGAYIRGSFNYGIMGYKITYTHNFGNRSLKGGRERSTGAEDELRRVN